MAFVPSHEHDIFVSYAHVDDLPFPGVEKGWVSTLVETLEILLAQKLGRREAYSLWMDHQLSRHAQLTPEILDNLGKTATLLVVLSPGYLASEWCQREKDAFLQLVAKKHGAGSRVFIVERDAVSFDQRPEAFRDLLGYRFWVQEGEGQPPRILGSPWPDPKNAENMGYFDQLTRLSCNLADELRQLRQAEEARASAMPGSTPRPETSAVPGGPSAAPAETDAAATDRRTAVFLAEVTDDLDARREEIRRYLEQAGLRVLPEVWYPRDPEGYRRDMARDLAGCSVFVQLLGPLAGKRPPDVPQGYLRLQHECALEAGIAIVQWRNRSLDLTSVDDVEHRAFLGSDTVVAMGSEELKRMVVERARPAPEPETPRTAAGDQLVFIDAEAGDIALAEALGDLLEQKGIGYALPLQHGTPAEVRTDFEQNLMFCDGVVIVHGGVDAKWVRDQMLVLRKLAWKRDAPLRAVAVLEGPPIPKDPVRFALPRLVTLAAGQGLEAADLAPFLDALAERA